MEGTAETQLLDTCELILGTFAVIYAPEYS